MKEFKSTDEILNNIYKELKVWYLEGYYDYICIYNILLGALIYSYDTGKISYKEFSELLQVIKMEVTE